MEKINFVNKQAPAINGVNLNQLQTNIENAINEIEMCDWIDISCENGYSNLDVNGYNKLQYKLKGKQVFIRGMMKNSKANPIGSNATCGSLPEGARPLKTTYLHAVQGGSPTSIIEVVIATSGQIQVYNTIADAWFSLDGLTFFID